MPARVVVFFGDQEWFFYRAAEELKRHIPDVIVRTCFTAFQLQYELGLLARQRQDPDILVMSYHYQFTDDYIDVMGMTDKSNRCRTIDLMKKFLPAYREYGFKGPIIAVSELTDEINEMVTVGGATHRADQLVDEKYKPIQEKYRYNSWYHESVCVSLIEGIVKIAEEYEEPAATEAEAKAIYCLLPNTAERKREDESYLDYFTRMIRSSNIAAIQ